MRGKEIDPFEHPAKRERPCDIAGLLALQPEWPDLNAICAAHGGAEIIEVKTAPIIPAFLVDVLCADSATAVALTMAWLAYSETSPHRPHSEEVGLAWGQPFNPDPDIPSDWTF